MANGKIVSVFTQTAYTRSIHAPQLCIQITLPAEAHKVDATFDNNDAFDHQTLALFAKTFAANRKGNATIGPEHSMPRQFQTWIGPTQNPAYQPRTSGQAGTLRYFAVTGHTARRNRRYCPYDCGMVRLDIDGN